jgi:hypothetical protein
MNTNGCMAALKKQLKTGIAYDWGDDPKIAWISHKLDKTAHG